ncbi:VOC family protein [Amycolatopsis ultiminotia]|uniref:VOC family protein n=1 Tax=Amycolatopsis ultiminotia TaxID=543629 RepID=A0ABP6VW20_9PSEU
MQFTSVRIITNDIVRLVAFYEKTTGIAARWPAPQFAELVGTSCTLAIGSTETMTLFSTATTAGANGTTVAESNGTTAAGATETGSTAPGSTGTVILEFLVDDVDREYEKLTRLTDVPTIVQKPTTMPWGNRSLLFRDPDGNLVNFFAPVTEDARARLAR